MTHRPSRPADRASTVDLGKTRSRFLLARVQVSAHAPTADYMRMRGDGPVAGMRRHP